MTRILFFPFAQDMAFPYSLKWPNFGWIIAYIVYIKMFQSVGGVVGYKKKQQQQATCITQLLVLWGPL